jgi:hypothetical protein
MENKNIIPLTLLNYAICSNNYNLVDLLLKNGAIIDNFNETYNLALFIKNKDIIELIRNFNHVIKDLYKFYLYFDINIIFSFQIYNNRIYKE